MVIISNSLLLSIHAFCFQNHFQRINLLAAFLALIQEFIGKGCSVLSDVTGGLDTQTKTVGT